MEIPSAVSGRAPVPEWHTRARTDPRTSRSKSCHMEATCAPGLSALASERLRGERGLRAAVLIFRKEAGKIWKQCSVLPQLLSARPEVMQLFGAAGSPGELPDVSNWKIKKWILERAPDPSALDQP